MSYQDTSDIKEIGNNMAVNAGALILFNKVVAPYIVADSDSETIKMLKAAGLITAIEELKKILARSGYDLRLFK